MFDDPSANAYRGVPVAINGMNREGMGTITTTHRTTVLTLELSRPYRSIYSTLSTVAWQLIIGEAAHCGIRNLRFANAFRPDAEVEDLSALASSEGLSVAASPDTGLYCGRGGEHAAVLSDGGLARCLDCPLIVGNVKDTALGELLATDRWLQAAGSPCPRA